MIARALTRVWFAACDVWLARAEREVEGGPYRPRGGGWRV